MKSWKGYYFWSDVVGPMSIFGAGISPQVEGKEVIPQLLKEKDTYYFLDYTVLESILDRMLIWESTTGMLKEALR